MKRNAFTLMELLVVISIFILLLAVGVPAFTAIAYSSERATAENMLRAGLSGARDAAVLEGRDTAAVFIFEPGGRASIITCVRAGRLNDADLTSDPDEPLFREVFVPIAGTPPVYLPKFWTVRGYAPEGMLDASWYERTYNTNALRNQGNWLLPETGFFASDETPSLGLTPVQLALDGADRQTFMVRFQGGSGQLAPGATDPILVLSPTAASDFRSQIPHFAANRADRETDPDRFIARVLLADSGGGLGLTLAQRQDLLGDRSSDTILAKPIGQLALANERRMARQLGLALDRATDSLYQAASTNGLWDPKFIATLDPNDVNRWMEQRYVPAGDLEPLASDVRVFIMNRYLGSPQEVSALAGVSP